jgi:hypothetical protein
VVDWRKVIEGIRDTRRVDFVGKGVTGETPGQSNSNKVGLREGHHNPNLRESEIVCTQRGQ